MVDGTAATKDEIKAKYKEYAEGFQPIEITATNPIDEAFVAEVNAGLKAAGEEALDIPVTADTEELRAQLVEDLAFFREQAGDPVLLAAPNTDSWREGVLGAIEEMRAEIAGAIPDLEIPVETNAADVLASVVADVEATRAEIGSIVVPVEADTAAFGSFAGEINAFSAYPSYPGAARLSPYEAPFGGLSGSLDNPYGSIGYTPAELSTMQSFIPPGAYAGGWQSAFPPLSGGPLFGGGEDLSAAARAQIAQAGNELTLPVKATNPIDDAWIAQVRSSIRSVAVDALSIPVNPELEDFETQLEATLTQLAETSKLDVPVDVGDAMIFREQVQQLVQQVESSVKAVIDVQISNEGALTDLQQKTAAAAQADLELVAAQDKLNQATASGDDDAIVKARNDVEAATKADKDATEALTAAQAAAAEGEEVVADATNKASLSMRGLMDAMGPLWMIMNVAQIAMFAFGGSSSSAATQAQDASSQIIALGEATGQTAQNLLMGNQATQQTASDLNKAGTSATQFSQAFATGAASAKEYVTSLQAQQQALANQHTTITQTIMDNADQTNTTVQTTVSIAQLSGMVQQHTVALSDLTPAQQKAVQQYDALGGSGGAIAQAQNALNGLLATEKQQDQTLAALGVHLSEAQKLYENYGFGVQSAAKGLADAEAGSTYLEDSVDKASIAAGQGVQQWQQLQAAVTSARQAYDAAGQGVANAEHSVEQAQQGVASAIHAEQQAVLAVQAAQTAYTNSLYQEGQAQQAVTAARAAAEQQLISLQLQANDAATSVDNANLSLFNAQQNAGKYGVNAGNAQQIADTQNITAANAAQVQAAIQLVQAENALADAQNSSTNAQSSLNTARQQGVDGNPQVLAAEHALQQAQDAVATAAQGVTNAQYAQLQAAQQVGNAEWSLQAASLAVGQAENAEASAAAALNTAQQNLGLSTDGHTRSVDANTLAGAQNRQELANLFIALQNATGNTQIATQWTEQYGGQMDFSKQSIDNVLGSLKGLNGTNAKFSIEGDPSINMMQLRQDALQIGLDVNALFGGGHAVGGPVGSGIALVGEQGPELVHLAPGSTVMPYANTQKMLKGFAAGGSVGSLDNPMNALTANFPMAAGWAAWDAVAQTNHVLGGGPTPQLPAPGNNDLGPFAAGAAAAGGSMAASSAIAAAAQAYAASRLAAHGWGPDQMPPLIKLWNQESGWNPYAVNPSSGAYGIPQSLGHGHPYDLGDYVAQVNWGEDYIAGRYGSPAAAWAHERAFNWYRAGGSSGGGLAMVGEEGPELVTVGGGTPVAAPGQHAPGVMRIEFGGGADGWMASAFKNAVRAGQIRFTLNGTQVVVG